MRLVVALATALALELALFFHLYSQPTYSAPAPLIMLLAPTTQTPYQKAYVKELIRRAAERDFDLIVLDARSDGERQIRQLEYAVASRPDRVLLMPRQTRGFLAGLELAQRLGVPVGVVNGELDPSEQRLTAFYVGPDNVREGQMAADLIAEAAPGGRVVLIRGPAGQHSSDARKQGFLERVKADRLTVVAERDGEWTEMRAEQAMRDVLSSGAAFDAVFAFDDTMARGVLRALKDAGRVDTTVVSINGSHDGMSLVDEGALRATILQSPVEEADLAFDRLFGKDDRERVHLPLTVITQKNVQSNRDRAW